MTQYIHNLQGLMVVMISTLVGGKTFSFVADATAADALIPAWIEKAMGPLGALVFMGLAIKWLLSRQATLEAKIDAREKERDEDRKKLIEVLQANNTMVETNNSLMETNNLVIRQNSDVLSKVNETLKK